MTHSSSRALAQVVLRIALGAALAGPAMGSPATTGHPAQAFTTASATPVHEQASDRSPRIGTLQPGQRVTLPASGSATGDWVRVLLPDGTGGFVERRHLQAEREGGSLFARMLDAPPGPAAPALSSGGSAFAEAARSGEIEAAQAMAARQREADRQEQARREREAAAAREAQARQEEEQALARQRARQQAQATAADDDDPQPNFLRDAQNRVAAGVMSDIARQRRLAQRIEQQQQQHQQKRPAPTLSTVTTPTTAPAPATAPTAVAATTTPPASWPAPPPVAGQVDVPAGGNPGRDAVPCLHTESMTASNGKDADHRFTNRCAKPIFVFWCGELRYNAQRCGSGTLHRHYTHVRTLGPDEQATISAQGDVFYGTCQGYFSHDGSSITDEITGHYRCLPTGNEKKRDPSPSPLLSPMRLSG